VFIFILLSIITNSAYTTLNKNNNDAIMTNVTKMTTRPSLL